MTMEHAGMATPSPGPCRGPNRASVTSATSVLPASAGVLGYLEHGGSSGVINENLLTYCQYAMPASHTRLCVSYISTTSLRQSGYRNVTDETMLTNNLGAAKVDSRWRSVSSSRPSVARGLKSRPGGLPGSRRLVSLLPESGRHLRRSMLRRYRAAAPGAGTASTQALRNDHGRYEGWAAGAMNSAVPPRTSRPGESERPVTCCCC
jgi:hypothetical protein